MGQVSIRVNGRVRKANVEPRLLLVHFLREQLNLTGTHIGCDTSQCGACTVLVDGRSAKSCTIVAVQADGSEVTTIEGLATNGQLHPPQEGFWAEHGLQCSAQKPSCSGWSWPRVSGPSTGDRARPRNPPAVDGAG